MGRNRPIPVIRDMDKEYIRRLLIFEDEKILAFNKPSGLPVQTRGNRGLNLDYLLWTFARPNGKRPRLVHRLDAETSGVIVAAKTQPAAATLSEAFATRRIEKTYLALIGGDLPEASKGRIDAPVVSIEMAGRQRMMAVDKPTEDAKSALTHWEILSRSDRFALIRLKPRTGRMHQLRVHMAYINCPILGDKIYGSGLMSAPRLMLHAAALRLADEFMPLNLSAPVPEDMIEAAKTCGLTI